MLLATRAVRVQTRTCGPRWLQPGGPWARSLSRSLASAPPTDAAAEAARDEETDELPDFAAEALAALRADPNLDPSTAAEIDERYAAFLAEMDALDSTPDAPAADGPGAEDKLKFVVRNSAEKEEEEADSPAAARVRAAIALANKIHDTELTPDEELKWENYLDRFYYASPRYRSLHTEDEEHMEWDENVELDDWELGHFAFDETDFLYVKELSRLADEALVAREKKPFEMPDGFDFLKPPPLGAWDPNCSSWLVQERNNSDLSNFLNCTDDPNDWATILEDDSFERLDLLDFRRIEDATKAVMYELHMKDKVHWTVSRLAQTFKMTQPRVQTILLFKAWEDEYRRIGLLLPEEEEFYDLHEQWEIKMHHEYVAELEEMYDCHIPRTEVPDREWLERGGAMGKIKILYDDERVPPPPDPEETVRRAAGKRIEKIAANQQQADNAIRVQKKRWQFVIKDSQPQP